MDMGVRPLAEASFDVWTRSPVKLVNTSMQGVAYGLCVLYSLILSGYQTHRLHNALYTQTGLRPYKYSQYENDTKHNFPAEKTYNS